MLFKIFFPPSSLHHFSCSLSSRSASFCMWSSAQLWYDELVLEGRRILISVLHMDAKRQHKLVLFFVVIASLASKKKPEEHKLHQTQQKKRCIYCGELRDLRRGKVADGKFCDSCWGHRKCHAAGCKWYNQNANPQLCVSCVLNNKQKFRHCAMACPHHTTEAERNALQCYACYHPKSRPECTSLCNNCKKSASVTSMTRVSCASSECNDSVLLCLSCSPMVAASSAITCYACWVFAGRLCVYCERIQIHTTYRQHRACASCHNARCCR